MTAPLQPQDLPLDAAALRRAIGWLVGRPADRPSRHEVTRVLMRTDAELLAMAVAVNRGLAAGDSVARITGRIVAQCSERRIDEHVVRLFLRAVGLERRVKRQGGYARYHERKRLEGDALGHSAYSHRRGPARTSIADSLADLDLDESDAFGIANDYIRGQGGL